MRYSTWIMIFAISCLAAAPRFAMARDPLIGKWKVKVTPNGTDANLPGVKEFDETLEFKPDQMIAKVMGEKGFKPATYDEDSSLYAPTKFKCTQTSDKEGKAEWSGTATDTDLTGTLVWTKKDGTVIHYDLQGSSQ